MNILQITLQAGRDQADIVGGTPPQRPVEPAQTR